MTSLAYSGQHSRLLSAGEDSRLVGARGVECVECLDLLQYLEQLRWSA